jgi:predicted esterase
MEKRPHFHDLVLGAGLPPEDIDYKSQQAYLADKNLYLIYGSQDPFLTEDRMQTVQEIERSNGIDFDEQSFQGGHEIPANYLQQLQRKLSS